MGGGVGGLAGFSSAREPGSGCFLDAHVNHSAPMGRNYVQGGAICLRNDEYPVGHPAKRLIGAGGLGFVVSHPSAMKLRMDGALGRIV